MFSLKVQQDPSHQYMKNTQKMKAKKKKNSVREI